MKSCQESLAGAWAELAQDFGHTLIILWAHSAPNAHPANLINSDPPPEQALGLE